jgi:hypothetical protein
LTTLLAASLLGVFRWERFSRGQAEHNKVVVVGAAVIIIVYSLQFTVYSLQFTVYSLVLLKHLEVLSDASTRAVTWMSLTHTF